MICYLSRTCCEQYGLGLRSMAPVMVSLCLCMARDHFCLTMHPKVILHPLGKKWIFSNGIMRSEPDWVVISPTDMYLVVVHNNDTVEQEVFLSRVSGRGYKIAPVCMSMHLDSTPTRLCIYYLGIFPLY